MPLVSGRIECVTCSKDETLRWLLTSKGVQCNDCYEIEHSAKVPVVEELEQRTTVPAEKPKVPTTKKGSKSAPSVSGRMECVTCSKDECLMWNWTPKGVQCYDCYKIEHSAKVPVVEELEQRTTVPAEKPKGPTTKKGSKSAPSVSGRMECVTCSKDESLMWLLTSKGVQCNDCYEIEHSAKVPVVEELEQRTTVPAEKPKVPTTNKGSKSAPLVSGRMECVTCSKDECVMWNWTPKGEQCYDCYKIEHSAKVPVVEELEQRTTVPAEKPKGPTTKKGSKSARSYKTRQNPNAVQKQFSTKGKGRRSVFKKKGRKRKYDQSGPSSKKQKNEKDKSNQKRKYDQSGPSSKKQKNEKDKSNDDLRFEELVDSLCSIFKCGVCLAVLEKDMVTCVNGHCTCTNCYSKIQPYKLCPTCREGFSNIKQNSLACHLLDIFPHTCRHNVDCPYLVRPGDDHESYCHFKIMRCKFCRQELQVVELSDHVKDNHPEEEIFSEKCNVLSYYDFEQPSDVTNKLLLSSYGHFLWILENINPTAGVITFQFVPVFCGKPEHDIYVKIVFRSDQAAAHKPEYEASTIVKMNSNVKLTEENCLFIPLSVAKEFYLQDSKKFFFYITISKTKQ